ncbi:phospholipase D-like domain-containing protein [Natronorubrum daqingense]|uniref:Phosphatidylserine/phosphatidylglycerophosphate/cardiolipin synthase n=1 Tax=Natronorubrum daqingense TaxID=588898 RepID=A0A1N6Y2P8_9EURY|nr:phospholipase D-like domain-containing protein [Natronorubrum daqingense]APX95797.1 phospholipase [Natronorubrum daqingense]SIR08781.1 Phosphatidylserine/phosphatidylglycerophosphate/cardiolipin synthase [Natronorubrum daqingense]
MDRQRLVIVSVVLILVVASGAGITLAATESASPASTATLSLPETNTEPACPAVVSNPGTGTSADTDVDFEPRIVEAFPNPSTEHNVGEYVVLETPPDTELENWTITDGHTSASIPNETVSGRVALSTDTEATDELTDYPVRELEGSLRLAVDGDDLELRNGSTTVDTVSYERASLEERWHRDADEFDTATTQTPADGDWHPRDATCVPVSSGDADEATPFVLPDEPELPRETIREAEDRLSVAGYTLTSEEIAEDLVDAADRGVDVSVLLEASPVGGTEVTTEPVLETLEDGDVEVRAIGGEGSRYRFHHPKYAVADDQVLVTSENWAPAGVGGESSRGWGVLLEDETLAADLEAVFDADFEGWDTVPGSEYREDTSFVDDEGGGEEPPGSYPSEYGPEPTAIEAAELLVAPDNAESRVEELLADADEEILVKQASIAADASVLEETIDAAHRGVDVQILLDSTWYHEDDNRALADELEEYATSEGLSLEVGLVEETDRFEKIHAKGVVIDREIAIVGSANWNENAFENNREVLLALSGEEIATYYADVFEDDWDGDEDRWALPFELSLTVVAALAIAAIIGRRYIRFGDPDVE